jgi:L-ascorbate metabolism protein UlaG (beta-lactamase superfamily)
MRLPSTDPGPAGRAARLRGLTVKWLGHSTFLLASPKGVRVLFDPFVTNNPSCPAGAKRIGAIDLILITHGHSDHCEDAAGIGRD